ncbi:hypothetical protein SDC9_98014 [bioreactor metagenome]|uniref:Uncharacterized protein n=1 Tax=bioreactor metagenome TaxID=1076179 RepID=A0A645AE82_9ZZZZ
MVELCAKHDPCKRNNLSCCYIAYRREIPRQIQPAEQAKARNHSARNNKLDEAREPQHESRERNIRHPGSCQAHSDCRGGKGKQANREAERNRDQRIVGNKRRMGKRKHEQHRNNADEDRRREPRNRAKRDRPKQAPARNGQTMIIIAVGTLV